MSALADKLSSAIRQSLRDLEEVEKDPRYVVDMGEWHKPNGKCRVCLAGAVLAKRLEIDIGTLVDTPANGSLEDANKLYALNDVREGYVLQAVCTFYDREEDDFYEIDLPEDREVADYHVDRVAFYRDMHFIADELAEAGY